MGYRQRWYRVGLHQTVARLPHQRSPMRQLAYRRQVPSPGSWHLAQSGFQYRSDQSFGSQTMCRYVQFRTGFHQISRSEERRVGKECKCRCERAEDGIRDRNVTGVQTCALPISPNSCETSAPKVTNAPIGIPPPSPFARVMASGTIGLSVPVRSEFWKPNHVPVRPIPDWISSNINSAPWAVQLDRTCAR